MGPTPLKRNTKHKNKTQRIRIAVLPLLLARRGSSDMPIFRKAVTEATVQ